MKTAPIKTGLFCLMLALGASPLLAQSGPSLYANVYWGNLTIAGYAGTEITWEAHHETANGRTRITGGDFLAVEKTPSALRLTGRRPAPGVFESIHLTLRVPYKTPVHLTIEKGGELKVTDVHALVEIDHRNGSVVLSGLRDHAIVHAVNGAISADFEAVAPDQVLSFITLNGGITLTLPDGYQANARLRTRKNGYINSDFDLTGTASPYAAEPEAGETKPRYSKTPISINAPINGGGPLLIAMTENGPIELIKSTRP